MDNGLINTNLLEGIYVTPLQKIADNRGMVLHMLRSTSNEFLKFKEIYFSIVYKNSVKAWKRHLRMTQNLAVPSGSIKLVCYDTRHRSKTVGKICEITFGRENYCLVTIPPLIWYGFQGKSDCESVIANCADLIHDPQEVDRKFENDESIPYRW